jgi:WD40 repeat protein
MQYATTVLLSWLCGIMPMISLNAAEQKKLGLDDPIIVVCNDATTIPASIAILNNSLMFKEILDMTREAAGAYPEEFPVTMDSSEFARLYALLEKAQKGKTYIIKYSKSLAVHELARAIETANQFHIPVVFQYGIPVLAEKLYQEPELQRFIDTKEYVDELQLSPEMQQELATALIDEVIKMVIPIRHVLPHPNSVSSVAWNPNNNSLASGSDDGKARIWDVFQGTLLTLNGHTDEVNTVAWRPDGRRLASGSGDNTVRIWGIHAGGLKQTLENHANWVNSISWRPGTNQLASGSEDKKVCIWNVYANNPLSTCYEQGFSVRAVSWSPDGTRLALGLADNTVRICDALTGAVIYTLQGHTLSVTSVAWSFDNTLLASASFDKTVRVWDALTGNLKHTLHGHEGSVHSVTWSSNGKFLASGSDDKTVRIWNVRAGTNIICKGHSASVRAVAWSFDDTWLASASRDETVQIRDIRHCEVMLQHMPELKTLNLEQVLAVAYTLFKKSIVDKAQKLLEGHNEVLFKLLDELNALSKT